MQKWIHVTSCALVAIPVVTGKSSCFSDSLQKSSVDYVIGVCPHSFGLFCWASQLFRIFFFVYFRTSNLIRSRRDESNNNSSAHWFDASGGPADVGSSLVLHLSKGKIATCIVPCLLTRSQNWLQHLSMFFLFGVKTAQIWKLFECWLT